MEQKDFADVASASTVAVSASDSPVFRMAPETYPPHVPGNLDAAIAWVKGRGVDPVKFRRLVEAGQVLVDGDMRLVLPELGGGAHYLPTSATPATAKTPPSITGAGILGPIAVPGDGGCRYRFLCGDVLDGIVLATRFPGCIAAVCGNDARTPLPVPDGANVLLSFRRGKTWDALCKAFRTRFPDAEECRPLGRKGFAEDFLAGDREREKAETRKRLGLGGPLIDLFVGPYEGKFVPDSGDGSRKFTVRGLGPISIGYREDGSEFWQSVRNPSLGGSGPCSFVRRFERCEGDEAREIVEGRRRPPSLTRPVAKAAAAAGPSKSPLGKGRPHSEGCRRGPRERTSHGKGRLLRGWLAKSRGAA
jgi:hypothetical protein